MTSHYQPAPLDWPEHDWCLATRYCRRCGASEQAVVEGKRAMRCEPGVVGISWVRATERMRDLMAPMFGDNFRYVSTIEFGDEAKAPQRFLPLYSLDDFVPRKPEPPSAA
jgi:hypothetical protein